MSTVPTFPNVVTSSAAGFQPAFKHIGTKDRHAYAFASIAIIASTTIEDVFKKAEELGMPATGPYSHWIDADFLASIFAKYGWVATVWKECTGPATLPDLCMALVDYDTDWEIGRFVVVHKAKGSHDAKFVTYAIDPAAADAKLYVRTDLDVLQPAWYIGVHPMGKIASSTKK